MDLNTLRNQRNTDFGAIASAFDNVANPQSDSRSFEDDRIWKLEADKAGNGTICYRGKK